MFYRNWFGCKFFGLTWISSATCCCWVAQVCLFFTPRFRKLQTLLDFRSFVWMQLFFPPPNQYFRQWPNKCSSFQHNFTQFFTQNRRRHEFSMKTNRNLEAFLLQIRTEFFKPSSFEFRNFCWGEGAAFKVFTTEPVWLVIAVQILTNLWLLGLAQN